MSEKGTFKQDVIEFVKRRAVHHNLSPIAVTKQLTEIVYLQIDTLQYLSEWSAKRIYDLEKEREDEEIHNEEYARCRQREEEESE